MGSQALPCWWAGRVAILPGVWSRPELPVALGSPDSVRKKKSEFHSEHLPFPCLQNSRGRLSVVMAPRSRNQETGRSQSPRRASFCGKRLRVTQNCSVARETRRLQKRRTRCPSISPANSHTCPAVRPLRASRARAWVPGPGQVCEAGAPSCPRRL